PRTCADACPSPDTRACTHTDACANTTCADTGPHAGANTRAGPGASSARPLGDEHFFELMSRS
ncbi:MAG: hypothetical protein ACREJS_02855, partial [Candidatus Rokuibacteriota bacterium]